MLIRIFTPITLLINLFFILSIIFLIGIYAYFIPNLPDISHIKEIKLQIPLRIYASNNELIAEYGEQRRFPVNYQDIPPKIVQAFLAAEDDAFFQHYGVDHYALIRASVALFSTGTMSQGGSTITMQLTRNLFLSSEKSYIRKIKEIFLAFEIEKQLSKQEILELYLNKIYLGHRAYGIKAAAQVYYGKTLEELNLAEMAMIASLPKAPSTFNPIVNPERALIRRDYILKRMYKLGYIIEEELQTAINTPEKAKLHGSFIQDGMGYFGEMVRAEMVDKYGEEKAYNDGLIVYTTLDTYLQQAANNALQKNLLIYDRNHGYRGPEAQILEGSQYDAILEKKTKVGNLYPGIVYYFHEDKAQIYLGASHKAIELYCQNGIKIADNQCQTPENTIEVLMANDDQTAYIQTFVFLDYSAVKWAKPYMDKSRRGKRPKSIQEVLNIGDLIRVYHEQTESGVQWNFAQIPNVSGALVSLEANTGAILAISGGFDFSYSKFNRATQAIRQPGSSFKPFIYSASLEKGYGPNSVVNDAPFKQGSWMPKNYGGGYLGPVSLKIALAKSRNLVVVRLLNAISVQYGREYAQQFGFNPKSLPEDLTLSLGTANLTPLELARGYTVFANGGYLVDSHFITKITDQTGNILYEHTPKQACDNCDNPAPRAISAANAYVMRDMMAAVIKMGTGRKALKLKRNDIYGKTGTTNEERDAWFAGFNPKIVAIAWVGFDDFTPLGIGERGREGGSSTALPMWIDFMEVALAKTEEIVLAKPEGVEELLRRRASIDLSGALAPEESNLTKADENGLMGGIW